MYGKVDTSFDMHNNEDLTAGNAGKQVTFAKELECPVKVTVSYKKIKW